MSRMILSAVVILASSVAVAAAKNIKRMPSSDNVKTLVCVTSEMSPNIDIRIEFAKDGAVVKLIDFGSDVSEAPTDGWSSKVTLQEAQDLIKGNAAMAFTDSRGVRKNENGKLLALKGGSGYVSLPFRGTTTVHAVTGCRAN